MVSSIASFDTLVPLYNMINCTCAREVADVAEAFRLRATAGTTSYTYDTIEEGVAHYGRVNEALLIIKPYQDRKHYNFDLYNFCGEEVVAIMRRFRIFEVDLIVAS
jgi:hypothetical protein